MSASARRPSECATRVQRRPGADDDDVRTIAKRSRRSRRVLRVIESTSSSRGALSHRRGLHAPGRRRGASGRGRREASSTPCDPTGAPALRHETRSRRRACEVADSPIPAAAARSQTQSSPPSRGTPAGATGQDPTADRRPNRAPPRGPGSGGRVCTAATRAGSTRPAHNLRGTTSDDMFRRYPVRDHLTRAAVVTWTNIPAAAGDSADPGVTVDVGVGEPLGLDNHIRPTSQPRPGPRVVGFESVAAGSRAETECPVRCRTNSRRHRPVPRDEADLGLHRPGRTRMVGPLHRTRRGGRDTALHTRSGH